MECEGSQNAFGKKIRQAYFEHQNVTFSTDHRQDGLVRLMFLAVALVSLVCLPVPSKYYRGKENVKSNTLHDVASRITSGSRLRGSTAADLCMLTCSAQIAKQMQERQRQARCYRCQVAMAPYHRRPPNTYFRMGELRSAFDRCCGSSTLRREGISTNGSRKRSPSRADCTKGPKRRDLGIPP